MTFVKCLYVFLNVKAQPTFLTLEKKWWVFQFFYVTQYMRSSFTKSN